MEKEDFDYILNSIANISALPIRLYHKNKMVNYYSIIDFPLDPIKIYEKDILKLKGNVATFSAPYFFFYGLIKVNEYKIVIGPTSISLREDNIKSLSYDLELPLNLYQKFKNAIEMTTSMPFTTFFQMVLLMNFVLNNEKREISEFIDPKLSPNIEKKYNESLINSEKYHFNSLAVEKELIKIISNGDLNALDVFVKNIKTIRSGTIAQTPLRNFKNLFIVNTTLMTRAAIKAGVDEEDAFSTSDALIMKLELLNDMKEVTNLYLDAVYTFTKKVSYYKGNNESEMANKLTTYILENISKNITLDDIASNFYISKSSLCSKFKNEVGITINEFILKKKIQFSLDLLKDKKKSIAYISEYLGFSSPPHFTKTFLKIMHITPSEYRNKLN